MLGPWQIVYSSFFNFDLMSTGINYELTYRDEDN